jgi:hypothetical protein
MNENGTDYNNDASDLRGSVEQVVNYIRSNPYAVEAAWITMILLAMRLGLRVNFPKHSTPTEYSIVNYVGEQHAMAVAGLLAYKDQDWPDDVINLDELVEWSQKYDVTLRVGDAY